MQQRIGGNYYYSHCSSSTVFQYRGNGTKTMMKWCDGLMGASGEFWQNPSLLAHTTMSQYTHSPRPHHHPPPPPPLQQQSRYTGNNHIKNDNNNNNTSASQNPLLLHSLKSNQIINQNIYRLVHGSCPKNPSNNHLTTTTGANHSTTTTNTHSFPHLFLYGPAGAGKSIRAHMILQLLYLFNSQTTENGVPNPNSTTTNNAHKLLSTTSHLFTLQHNNKQISTHILQSQVHVEIDLSIGSSRYYDHILIAEIFKDLAMRPRLDSLTSASSHGTTQLAPFRIFIVNNVHLLSHSAQAALRRLMEKYHASCRLILIGRSINGVIGAIRSRCLLIRIPAPSLAETIQVLKHHTEHHLHAQLSPNDVYQTIAKKADGNLRKGKLLLEAYHSHCTPRPQSYPQQYSNRGGTTTVPNHFSPERQLVFDWEQEILNISRMVVANQTVSTIQSVRSKFYLLLENGIQPVSILKKLSENLMDSCVDHTQLHAIAHDASVCEYRMKGSHRGIFHLEAFIVRFMKDFKKSIAEMCGDFM